MSQERLQKVVARAGVASRRAAEDLILKGRVRVNGAIVTTLGTKVDPRADKVEVDGKRLVAESAVYFVLHKPRGVVSTVSDPEGRKTVRSSGPGDLGACFPGRAARLSHERRAPPHQRRRILRRSDPPQARRPEDVRGQGARAR